MNCCLSAGPRKFVGLAAAVTDGFAPRASEYDCENTFPHRSCEGAREVEFSTSGSQTRRTGRETQRAHPAGQTAIGRLVPHSQRPPEGHDAQGCRRLGQLVLVTNEMGLPKDVTDMGTQAVNVSGLRMGSFNTSISVFNTSAFVAPTRPATPAVRSLSFKR